MCLTGARTVLQHFARVFSFNLSLGGDARESSEDSSLEICCNLALNLQALEAWHGFDPLLFQHQDVFKGLFLHGFLSASFSSCSSWNFIQYSIKFLWGKIVHVLKRIWCWCFWCSSYTLIRESPRWFVLTQPWGFIADTNQVGLLCWLWYCKPR